MRSFDKSSVVMENAMGIGTLDQESKGSYTFCLRHITKGANFDLEWLRSSLNDGPGLRIDIFVQEEDRVV
jgi:hypothetical protein